MGGFNTFSHSRSIILALLAAAVLPIAAHAQYQAKVLFTMTTPSNFIGTSLPQPQTFREQPTGNGQAVAAMTDTITLHRSNAFLWTGPSDPIDLQPNDPTILSSGAIATNGSQQVGWISTSFALGARDAAYWNGTANSVVSLKPNLPGIVSSYAYATSGNQQLGIGFDAGGSGYFLLWDGTAASARIMPGELLATNGTEQVGLLADANGNSRPYVYKGTPTSGIELTVGQYGSVTAGQANAISPTGNQIVGSVVTADGVGHDIVWGRDGSTATDITPTNILNMNGAVPLATNGTTIVGWGQFGNLAHALVWVNGDPNNVIDLQSILPSNFFDGEAYSIDADGNIYGLALGSAQVWSAVEWSPVPEPATVSLLITTAALLRRRK